MKLKNKKTGKVLAVESISSVVPTLVADKKTIQLTGTDIKTGYREMYRYKILAELNAEWEDAPEEPKGFWSISGDATIEHYEWLNENDHCKEIGNYFETKEEAELAVCKLKAWKRLKDRRWFRFDGYDVARNSNGDLCGQLFFKAGNYCIGDVEKYLDLLFGGEE